MVAYSVVLSWVLSYLLRALMTGFVGIDATASQSAFNDLLAGPWQMLADFLPVLLTGAIIYAGVQKGIERAVRY